MDNLGHVTVQTADPASERVPSMFGRSLRITVGLVATDAGLHRAHRSMVEVCKRVLRKFPVWVVTIYALDLRGTMSRLHIK